MIHDYDFIDLRVLPGMNEHLLIFSQIQNLIRQTVRRSLRTTPKIHDRFFFWKLKTTNGYRETRKARASRLKYQTCSTDYDTLVMVGWL